MVGIMYPLQPVSDLQLTRNHEAIANAINTFEGRKFDYTPRNIVEQNYARYSTDQVERIRNDVVMGALRGSRGPAGVAARGTQVDHLRERGVHRDAAAADAAHGCARRPTNPIAERGRGRESRTRRVR